MKDFFLRLHPWVRILIIFVIILLVLVILNYQPSSEKKIETVEEIFDMDMETGSVENTSQVEVVAPVVASSDTAGVAAQPTPAAPAAVAESTPPAKAVEATPKITGNFYSVQVASSQDEAKSKQLVEKLKKDGFTAEVSSKMIEGKGTWFRVYVERFEKKADAEAKAAGLQAKYPGSFVILRKE